MVSKRFGFIMSMFMFCDLCGGIEGVRFGNIWVGMVGIVNGVFEWLD